MLRIVPSTMAIFLVVILQLSTAAPDSSEISSEDLTQSQDTDLGTFPNRDSSQDESWETQHWVSDFRHRLQELSTWLDIFTDNYVERKYTEVSPKARGRVLRHMPRGFVKRQLEKDDARGFLRTRKSQVSRMPMSFGKRDVFGAPVNDLYGQELPDVEGHSQTEDLNTMVNKVDGSLQDEKNDFTRTRKGKLGRMPMAFGKRSGTSIASDEVLWENKIPETQKKYVFDYRPVFDNEFRRVAKDKLGRMPMAFGKRSGTSTASDEVLRENNISGTQEKYAFDYRPVFDDEFRRVAKDKLGRMPMAYGKRSRTSTTNDEVLQKNNISEMQKEYTFDYKPVFNDEFRRVAKGKLGRMPMAYGKRSTSTASDEVLRKNKISEMQKEFAIDYRPVFDDEFERVAKDRLDRMPMAYGKRIPHSEYASIAEQQQKDTIIRPYLKFGKPAMDGKHNDQPEDVILRKVSDDMAPAGSEGDANVDHEASNVYSRVSTGSFNRTPFSFRKRAAPNKMTASLSNKAVANEHVAVRADGSSTAFGKRDPHTYQLILKMLGSKMNSPKSEMTNSIHGKIKILLNQFLEKEDSLKRLTRSKLDRMPITYGKRSDGYSGQMENLSTMYSRVMRPKLGRMPLAFGKRMFSPRGRNNVSKMRPLPAGVHTETGEDEGSRIAASWSSGDAGVGSAPGCASLTGSQNDESNIMCKSQQRKPR